MRDATQADELEDGSSNNTVQLLIFGGVLLLFGLLFFGTVALVMILKNGDDNKVTQSPYDGSNSPFLYNEMASTPDVAIAKVRDIEIREHDLVTEIDVARIDDTLERIERDPVATRVTPPAYISGIKPLTITSLPPRAVPGTNYTYQLSATRTVTYKLIQGPTGMTVSESGVVKWPVDSQYDGKSVATVSVTDQSGRTIHHNLRIEAVNR